MERSLILVKPDATGRNVSGAILSYIEKQGPKLVALKLMHIDKALAERHYAEHKEKSFFPGLVKYITSGPVVAAVFEGDNAIEKIRKIMGPTDPAKAPKGTIRADFGQNIEQNAVHGSANATDAAREVSLFFKDSEIYGGK